MIMKNYTYRVIIEPDGDFYHAYVPALPGCHTFGSSVEEAKENINEAISVYIASLRDDQQPIPEDEGMETISTVFLPTSLKHV